MSKQTEALKLALEALEETRNALAWFYDSYPEDVTPKGNELLPHVEVVLADLRVALTSNSRALEQPAQQDYWQEEARRYAQNADFWRGKYESATAQRKPLTDEQIDDIWNRYCDEMGEASINDAYDIARAIEAAHGIKEKNT